MAGAIDPEKLPDRILLVAGEKNAGKTTFLRKLIPALKKRGVRTAVIKHDRHGFDCDREGTDSDLLRRAGAEGTAVVHGGHVFLNLFLGEEPDPGALAAAFPDADLILAEGFRGSPRAKIEVTAGSTLTAEPEGRFLAAAADPGLIDPSCGCEVIGRDDAETAADRILERFGAAGRPGPGR